jgi:hypothetical protein
MYRQRGWVAWYCTIPSVFRCVISGQTGLVLQFVVELLLFIPENDECAFMCTYVGTPYDITAVIFKRASRFFVLIFFRNRFLENSIIIIIIMAAENGTTKQCVWIIRYGLTKHPLVENLGPFDGELVVDTILWRKDSC